MDRIRVYTGGVASCNGYLFKTRDNAYVAVDAPSGFADWIYSKKPDIIITDLLIISALGGDILEQQVVDGGPGLCLTAGVQMLPQEHKGQTGHQAADQRDRHAFCKG